MARQRRFYNHWKRWGDFGVFAQIMMGLAEQAPDNHTLSIDATYLKAHRTASSLRLKRGAWTPDRFDHGLHAVTDTSGRPVRLFITAGQVSDYTGAAALMNGLPKAQWRLADRGYGADCFRETRVNKGTKPCIPGRTSRKK